MFSGSIVALITPFTLDGEVDYASLKKLVDYHVEAGTDGIVAVGTTGESATLTVEEHVKVVAKTVEFANGRIPVIAGTGANATHEAVTFSRLLSNVGIVGCLSVTPYYNKPTQEGLYQHYKAINDSVGIPIIIYNIPGRSVVDMSVETMARLYELKNIIGVKDATGNLDRATEQRNLMGKDFLMLSGNDENSFEFNQRGGSGCISVSSNVAPKICSEFHRLSLASENEKAKKLFDQLLPLHEVMFVESNPVPAKYSLMLLGLMTDDVRLPLVKGTEDSKKKIKQVLADLSII